MRKIYWSNSNSLPNQPYKSARFWQWLLAVQQRKRLTPVFRWFRICVPSDRKMRLVVGIRCNRFRQLRFGLHEPAYFRSRGTTKSISRPYPNFICFHSFTGTSHTSVAAVGNLQKSVCIGWVCKISLAKYPIPGLCPRMRTGESSTVDNASNIDSAPPWYRLDSNRTSYILGIHRSILLHVCLVLFEVEHITVLGMCSWSASHLPIASDASLPRFARGRSWSFRYGESQLDLACRVMISFMDSRCRRLVAINWANLTSIREHSKSA